MILTLNRKFSGQPLSSRTMKPSFCFSSWNFLRSSAVARLYPGGGWRKALSPLSIASSSASASFFRIFLFEYFQFTLPLLLRRRSVRCSSFKVGLKRTPIPCKSTLRKRSEVLTVKASGSTRRFAKSTAPTRFSRRYSVMRKVSKPCLTLGKCRASEASPMWNLSNDSSIFRARSSFPRSTSLRKSFSAEKPSSVIFHGLRTLSALVSLRN